MRTKRKLIDNPDKAFEEIVHSIGSSTGPIFLKGGAAIPKCPVMVFTNNYSYRALDQNGQEVTGEMVGDSEADVINKIRKDGLYPTQVSRMKAPAAQGFTLIELLVVIVIVGILGAMIIPFFGSSQEEQEQYSPEREVFELRQTTEALRAENAALQKLMISKLAAPEAAK